MDHQVPLRSGKPLTRRKPPPLTNGEVKANVLEPKVQRASMERSSTLSSYSSYNSNNSYQHSSNYNQWNSPNYTRSDQNTLISPMEANHSGYHGSPSSVQSQTYSNSSTLVSTPMSINPPPLPTKPPKEILRRQSSAMREFLGDSYYDNRARHSIPSDPPRGNMSFETPRPMGPKELPDYFIQDANPYKSGPTSHNIYYSKVNSPYANVYDSSLQPSTPTENYHEPTFNNRAYYQPNQTTPYPLEESDYISSSPEYPEIASYDPFGPAKTQHSIIRDNHMKLPPLSSGSLRSSDFSTSNKTSDIGNRNQSLRTPGSSKSGSPIKPDKTFPPKSRSSWSISSRSPSPRKYASVGNLATINKSLEDLTIYDDNEGYNIPQYYEDNGSRSPTLSSGWNSDNLEDKSTGQLTTSTSLPQLPSVPFSSIEKIDLQNNISVLKKKDDELPPIPLDLPALPFSSSSLVSTHFQKCETVWSLSSVFNWCKFLTIWLHDSDIPKTEFKTALVRLIFYHRPNIPLDTVEKNVNYIISTFLDNMLIAYKKNEQEPKKEDTVLFFDKYVNGVLPDLTNCYCSHNVNEDLKCYSSQCYLNNILNNNYKLKAMSIDDIVLGSDWPSHWKLTADDFTGMDQKEVKKQCQIFDLIRRENQLVIDGKRFVEVYGQSFLKQNPPIVGDAEKFHDDAFMVLEPFIEIHRKYLVEPLLEILINEGKFVTSISEIAEIFIEWTHVAKMPFLKYSGKFEVVKAVSSNEKFKAWLYNVDPTDKERERYFTRTFFKPVTETPLTLKEIGSGYSEESTEYQNVMKAVRLIKKLGEKVEQMQSHTEKIQNLKAVKSQLVWKPNLETRLNLGSENRELVKRGDVTRKGDLKINSYAAHLILLDNFLLITDMVKSSKNVFKFRVSERPIPIEFLLVEVKDETSHSPIDIKQGIDLLRTATATSDVTLSEEPSSYAFKIRFAGRGKHNAFTFSTKSESDRSEWLHALERVRSQLCERLNKGDPFMVTVVTDSAFAYEEFEKPTKLPLCAPNDPIDVACNKVHSHSQLGDFPRPLFVSRVLSSATFNIGTKKFNLIGLKFGVYANESEDPRSWKRVLDLSMISQISVLVEMNLVIVLSNKFLLYYPLDALLSVYKGKRVRISGTKITNKEVSFYKVGQHKGMTMLFYAKARSTSSTTFKVIIPQTDNGGVFSSFSVAKKFYIQAECYGISIFNTTFAIHTTKGFEILDLDKLVPRSVPELPAADQTKKVDSYSRKPLANGVEIIRKSVNSTSVKPMGMFKLQNNSEFLLVYNDCAIFTNKHGKLSRFSMLRFEFKAKKVTFDKNYLFLICDEVTEIWSISDFVNGTNKLIQVITGKEINLISTDNMPTIVLAHPKVPGRQLVLDLVESSSI